MADREQTRRDAELRKFLDGNGYEVVSLGDGSRSAVPIAPAAAIAELDALLAELEQAERPCNRCDSTEVRLRATEARLASVPALVEDVTTAAYCGEEETVTVEQVQQILREALTVWEEEA